MRKTLFHQSHLDLGAKMGEFAGYDMPLYYGLGVMKEHEWVREHAGLFDVSHMGQIVIHGPGVAEFLERITPSSFQNKKNGRAQYTVLTNENGGIIDDLIITRINDDTFGAVINAGCKDKDIAWIKSQLPAGIDLTYFNDLPLLALQGPKAEKVLLETGLMDRNIADLTYMNSAKYHNIVFSRLGYTGEDGFELSCRGDEGQEIFDTLIKHPDVKPIGLAARDSLRLEMGYALYGHDIDDKTTPVEAGLSWVMGKDNTGFIGAQAVLKDKENGPARKLVGIRLTDKGVAREGAEIRNEKDHPIGVLTGGGFSPTLKHSIGQGYVQSEHAQTGTPIFVNVRGKNIAAEIVKLPHVKAKTKTAPKAA